MTTLLQEHPQAEDVTRTQPHAQGPEKSLLSSMLQDPREFIGRAIEQGLTPSHFYLPGNATLFEYLLGASEQNEEIEPVSLLQKLSDKGLLDKVGGPAAYTEIYTYAPSSGHFDHHLKMVKDKFTLRSIIRAMNEGMLNAYENPGEADEVLDTVEKLVMDIREGQGERNAPVGAAEGMRRVVADLEALQRGKEPDKGLETGFEELDRLSKGLKPGEVFVIAARPSMGKTSFMMNIVEHVCVDNGNPTLVFSCEVPNHMIYKTLTNRRAKLATPDKPLDKGDLIRYRRAVQEIAASPLAVDDTGAISLTELRTKARRAHRNGKANLIAIDYLQLMRSYSRQATNSREREISEISAGIKALAKELNIPIILLAQLNRDSEKRSGTQRGVPRMSDLRESGSIEQDADMVGLLYREEYFADSDEDKEESAGRAKLILAKNRNGETGDVPLTFIKPMTRFVTGSPAPEPQQPAIQTRY